MDLGMLWFDNDPTTPLSNKVDRAAVYYHKKYGQLPTLCYVNPAMFAEEETKNCTLEIKANQSILHHHLWIGVAVEKEEQAG